VDEERPVAADDVGASSGLQVSGLDALRAIAADRVVRDVGSPTPVLGFRSRTGRMLGVVRTHHVDGAEEVVGRPA
jgi:hypothetical protein